jgi:hypothetical protein
VIWLLVVFFAAGERVSYSMPTVEFPDAYSCDYQGWMAMSEHPTAFYFVCYPSASTVVENRDEAE